MLRPSSILSRRHGPLLWTALLAAFGVTTAAPGHAEAQIVGERIVGGHDASPQAWPYQAYLQIRTARGDAACGGTLIAARWVLTAAHCVVDGASGAVAVPDAVKVRLGSVDRLRGGDLIAVSRVIAHEQYGARFSLENDIALLELARPVAMRVATLESDARTVSTQASPWAKVIGWGIVDVAAGRVSDRLQEAAVPLVEAGRCNSVMGAMFPKAGAIDLRRICAGSSEGGVDSCNGDSGGPLLVSDGRGGWVQVGIVSYGVRECGKPGTYGVYTRVGAYQDWIAIRTGLPKVAPKPVPKPAVTAGTGQVAAPVAAPPAKPAAPPAQTPVAPIVLGATASAPTIMESASSGLGLVSVAMPRRRLRLGEQFAIEVTSRFDGHLLLFDLNNDNELTQLFPNPRSVIADKAGRIRAGAPLRLPDPSYGFALEASEPRGRGRLLAIVVSDPALLADFAPEKGFKPVAAPQTDLKRLDVIVSQASGARWAATVTDYVVE